MSTLSLPKHILDTMLIIVKPHLALRLDGPYTPRPNQIGDPDACEGLCEQVRRPATN